MQRKQIETRLREVLVVGLRLEIEPRQIRSSDAIFGEGLGLDSIDALELVVLIEEEFGVEIPDDEQGRAIFSTVGTLTDFLESWPKRRA